VISWQVVGHLQSFLGQKIQPLVPLFECLITDMAKNNKFLLKDWDVTVMRYATRNAFSDRQWSGQSPEGDTFSDRTAQFQWQINESVTDKYFPISCCKFWNAIICLTNYSVSIYFSTLKLVDRGFSKPSELRLLNIWVMTLMILLLLSNSLKQCLISTWLFER
jgi:hypothetical protein